MPNREGEEERWRKLQSPLQTHIVTFEGKKTKNNPRMRTPRIKCTGASSVQLAGVHAGTRLCMCVFMFHSAKFCCWISAHRLPWKPCLYLSAAPSLGSMLSHCHSAVSRRGQPARPTQAQQHREAGRGGAVGATLECVCTRAVSRQRGAKADTLHLDHLL